MDELIRVTRGVWRPRLVAEDFRARIAALLSVLPIGTVVSGWTAALLHGLWLPPRPYEVIEVIVHPEVAALNRRAHSVRTPIRTRRQHLAGDEITQLDGFRVTTEARTWLDLAARLPLADLVAAGDSVLRGATDADELAELVRRAFHRPGVVRARAALPLLDGRARSRPESHLRYAIVSAGLPKPAVNEPIHDAHGGWLAEPDLSYLDVRLALEYNGAGHAEPPRMRKDITRAVDMSGARWRTEVFGPVEVFSRPDLIPVLVRQLRAERALEIPARLSGDLGA